MLEIKISELPAATTPLDGTEVFPLVQGVETKKVSIDGLFDQANMGTPASIDLTNATNVPGGGISGTVAIANGGTGATTAAGARTNLGVTATGMDTTYLYRTNNLSDLNSASSARTNLGLGSAAVLTAGAANGVATLDSSGTVPLSQIPAAIQGALNYQGTWNASTNTPTLTSSVGTKGYYYVVSTAGSTNLNGVTDWQIGDWAVFNGSIWQKIDNTDAVTSVNGYTGTVVLTQSDISGTVPITKGGTGQITQQLAINALAGSLTSGYYLRGDGTNVLMSAIQAADVPTLNQNTTGTASNVTGIVAIANGGTGASTAATARTNLGLGTMATQDATGVAITGGAINGTTVGATTPSTGKFTNLEATGTLTGSNGIMAIGTSQIYKDASGNVGFNNIVPAEKIDVMGNIKASGSITAGTQFTGPGTGLTGTAASLSIGGNAANVTGIVAAANGGTGQSSYAVGDLLYASTTTALSKLADVATGNALISGGVGVAPSYGKIGLTTHVSGTLPTANGGTGLSSFTANGVVYASSTSALTTGSALTFDGANFSTTGSATGTAFIPSGSTVPTNGMYLPTTNSVAWSTNTTERMRLDASGNVGIGVTPSAWASGNKFIDVNASASYGAFGSTDSMMLANAYWNGTNWIRKNANNAWRMVMEAASGAPSWTFQYAGNSTAGSTISWSEAMRLDSSGNVGIGTSNPSYKLHVIGQGFATTGWALTTDGSTFTPSGLSAIPNYGLGAPGSNFVSLAGFGGLSFYTNQLERMRIDQSGNVGIGVVPNASAILDAQSTTKGVRMPNMTTTQKNAISSPAAGLMVFDTTLAKLCVYSGSAWQTVTSI